MHGLETLIISLGVGEFKKQFRLEETQVRIAFHHVLSSPLSAIKSELVGNVRLDVGQRENSRFSI
jgi:hypothetical protein